MTDPESHDSINTYLSVTALVAEARRGDALALIGSLEPEEQIDMWIAGCSIAYALALEVAGRLGIPAEHVPAWLRAMSALADEAGDTDD